LGGAGADLVRQRRGAAFYRRHRDLPVRLRRRDRGRAQQRRGADRDGPRLSRAGGSAAHRPLRTELFPKVHRRYEKSPFAADLEEFASWLCAVGYSRENICDHLFRLRSTLERIEGLSPRAIFTEIQLERAFTSSQFPALYRGTQRGFARFLRQQRRLVLAEPNDPFATLRADYRQHLAELRGFAAATIQQHESTLSDFLLRGLPSKTSEKGLRELTRADIDRYVQLKSKEVSRQTLQHIVAHLRAFLRYCRDRGLTAPALECLDTPRTYRGELPPRALAWKLVLRLLASIDRTSRAGWRDYAILHLMAYYGLRPSEIATLTLASIDWNAKTVSVEQRKTRSLLVLPLADRTVNLLRRYLRHGRPATDRPELFLRVRSPAGALKHYAVVSIFEKRARLSGLPLQGSSSYGLRHAFAMRLLRRGVGVKAIGDLLGHRSLESTCVYLRLDTDMLRTVALPVPGVEHG
jgi:site-specific recombinase XerD